MAQGSCNHLLAQPTAYSLYAVMRYSHCEILVSVVAVALFAVRADDDLASGSDSCSCTNERALDGDCCTCTVAQVAQVTSMYFKERLEQLVEAPMFKVYTPYPDYPGKELYDVECSIPEIQELAQELSELQLGCAIQQCGCAQDSCGAEQWRHEPCFKQCEDDKHMRDMQVMDLVPTRPVLEGSGGPAQYDLTENPEQFTGYGTLLDDKSAGRIWESLYSDKFCFSSCPAGEDSEPSPEKRLVYKLVSGLHASINTHIAMHYEFFKETQEPATRENWGFGSDLQFKAWKALFDERVGRHPDRIRNLHFVFALMLRALHRLEPQLDRLLEAGADACPKCARQHNHTRDLLRQLLKPPEHAPNDCVAVLQAFDDSVLFRSNGREDASRALKNEVKKRFERMGNLMTCVGCDRCKLWGTLQFHAVRTAVAILFAEIGDDAGIVKNQFAVPLWTELKPNDIVALVNALAQVSKSIDQVKEWSSSDRASKSEL